MYYTPFIVIYMTEKFRKWSCYLCGDIVIEGQRFGYLPDKGFIHIECLYESISKHFNGRIPSEVIALIDFDEVAAYGIIRVKQVEKVLPEDLRKPVESGRHKLEGLSALAGKLLEDVLKKYDVNL